MSAARGRKRPPIFPWPIRGVVAGAAGTLAMTLAYAAERRVRAGRVPLATLADGSTVRGLASDGALDYDDSVVPGRIVANILHLRVGDDRAAGELAIALRWGYGSAFGIAHVFVRHRIAEPWASVVFGGVLMGMTFTMFPLLGHTPPPWRWSPDAVATAVGTHAAYVAAAALTDDLLR